MTRREHLLVCLMEECAEVQQVCSKILRFGYGNYHPHSGVQNTESLHLEIGDLIGILRMLDKDGSISLEHCIELAPAKMLKMAKYMDYSMDKGTLDKETETANG